MAVDDVIPSVIDPKPPASEFFNLLVRTGMKLVSGYLLAKAGDVISPSDITLLTNTAGDIIAAAGLGVGAFVWSWIEIKYQARHKAVLQVELVKANRTITNLVDEKL